VYAILVIVLAALAVSLGLVQAASDAIFSRAAAPASVPAHLSADWGASAYAAIEKIAPAPYVAAMLATAALDRNDLPLAQSYAQRLPESPARAELLGRVAQARGDRVQAYLYFVAANDVFAIRREVNRLAARDPMGAYALESRLTNRLERTATHPDALADAYWGLGRLATQLGYLEPAHRRAWFEEGMRDYDAAVKLAPLAGRYLIAAGSQELNLDQPARAHVFFKRAIDGNPASADAYAGLGVAAFRLGDLASARQYERLSRSYDPHSHFLHTLQALLR
jgi:tetratricopeptide (TPR) repeat protein